MVFAMLSHVPVDEPKTTNCYSFIFVLIFVTFVCLRVQDKQFLYTVQYLKVGVMAKYLLLSSAISVLLQYYSK